MEKYIQNVIMMRGKETQGQEKYRKQQEMNQLVEEQVQSVEQKHIVSKRDRTSEENE